MTWDWREQRGSGLPGFGEDSRESGRKMSAMINGFDKLSHLEKQENLSPVEDRKPEWWTGPSAACKAL